MSVANEPSAVACLYDAAGLSGASAQATFYAADESGKCEGIWVEGSGRQRCGTENGGSYHWGALRFQFNTAYTQFEGTWDFCGVGQKLEWRGKRVGG